MSERLWRQAQHSLAGHDGVCDTIAVFHAAPMPMLPAACLAALADRAVTARDRADAAVARDRRWFVRIRDRVGRAAAQGGAAGRGEGIVIALALVAGVLAAGAVTLMSVAAQYAHVLIFGIPVDVHLSAHAAVTPAVALAAPTLGGLALGVMEWLRRRWRLPAPVDPIEANALRGGRMSLRDSLVVSGQTLISNGCGASVGLEAGYTQAGAGLASLIGRLFRLRREDLRTLVGCGAAAAIAAAFGAPLTGVFYGCELVLGIYSVRTIAPVLAAAIAAALTARWLGGAPYLLDVPPLGAAPARQYLALLTLALMASLLGIAMMRATTLVEQMVGRTRLPVWLRPALGGLCVGALAVVTPQVLAAGHGAMQLDLARDMTAGAIMLLIVLKLTACLVSLASGFRGGLFFASLFAGCLIGKLFAVVAVAIAPDLAPDPVTSMLTGMATFAVAIVGGPLTMALLVLEATRNIEVAGGVLAGCVITSVVVRNAFGHSFATWRLHLRGETIRGAHDVGWTRALTVERMMRTDVVRLRGAVTIADARRQIAPGSHTAVVVIDDTGGYVGLLFVAELFSAAFDDGAAATPIAAIVRHTDDVLCQGMDISAAMACFERAGADRLAVVADPASREVIGLLSEAHATRRYIAEARQTSREVFE